jgi:gliding motility-associated-like protein
VEDANGCISSMSFGFSLDAFLTAAFVSENAVVEPGSTVNFHNQTQFSETKEVKYRWFVNGNQYSTETNSSFRFNNSGTYTIRLIADFTDQSCSDTAEHTIVVKNQNAAFALETGFVKNSGCPPLVVNFNATVQGNATVKWNFGDGSRSENITAPSHSYHNPGKFYITMEAIFPNGDTIRGIDSVEVQGMAKADLDADNWSGCTAQQVELKTSGQGLIYAWDFGDGSVLTNNSQTALHAYRTSGIYKPTLLVMDAAGCRQLAETTNRIIIDSLSISLNENPDRFCENNTILLTPSITSVAEQAGYALTYQWDLGSSAVTQFSTDRIPAFNYSSAGVKNIQFSVQSPLGCRQTVSKSFTIDQLIRGSINGPDNVCADEPVQFETSAQAAGLAWNWNLGNGQTSRQQNPDRLLYPAGNYLIELYTINQSCIHRAEKTILVSPLPDLQVSSSKLDICKGESIRVTASGASDYNWSPATDIDQSNPAAALITPAQTGIYTVKGRSDKGCITEKQVSITVIPDYELTVSPDTGICLGASVPIKVAGAASYQWIGSVEGLSAVTSPTPVARPVQTTRYTVRTEGQAGCFVKERDITIEVYPLPQVQLGPDISTYAGNPVSLNTTTSQDVTRWKWSPANYLNCSDCPNPVALPVNDIVYKLEVSNSNGCTASDEIKLIIGCNEDKIAIPNAFTPNADGKNDRFQFIAPGINEVESFQIYNRFGQLVHEVKNAVPGSPGVAWDGRVNGNPQPAGTYVYYLQLRCANNEKFVRKGTVVLIY